MQKIGVQFWRLFARYDERQAKFSTWLYRIALNVAISQARRARWSESGRFGRVRRMEDNFAGSSVRMAEAVPGEIERFESENG